jgi:glutaconate CoA-transferase subunit B
MLAHRLHAPSLRLLLGFGWTSLGGGSAGRVELAEDATDHRNARGAEGWMRLETMIDDYRFFSDAFVIGALQIDRFGNSNLIGIGDDHRKLRFRGPGTMGSVSSTGFCDRFYLAPSRHDTRVFVESCDFVSAVGWGEGGPEGRSRLGLPGGGPQLCVTPLCVFGFDDETKAMRLRSVHAGHTAEEVIERTGFEVVVPPDVPETEPPRPEELELLRTVIDPHGVLRGGERHGG